MTLKEDVKLFEYVVSKLDNTSGELERLAKDFVMLFFADFTSTEKNVIIILRQLKGLISKTLSSSWNEKEGNQHTVFGNKDLMVNRIINAFINSSENRDYLNLLFGKLFFEATGLKHYIKKIKARNTTLTISDKETSGEQKFVLVANDKSMIGAGHLSYRLPSNSSSSDPEEKGQPSGFNITNKETEDNMEDTLLLSEGVLNRIIKKLVYMPLSMRYFCKLLEHIVIQLVTSHSL